MDWKLLRRPNTPPASPSIARLPTSSRQQQNAAAIGQPSTTRPPPQASSCVKSYMLRPLVLGIVSLNCSHPARPRARSTAPATAPPSVAAPNPERIPEPHEAMAFQRDGRSFCPGLFRPWSDLDALPPSIRRLLPALFLLKRSPEILPRSSEHRGKISGDRLRR